MATTIINNSNQLHTLPVTVLSAPAAGPEVLIYDPITNFNAIFPIVNLDFVTPPLLYHGGYNKIALSAAPVFFDTTNVTATNTSKEIVSDYRTKGIMELRLSNSNYYWDEVYTTPLGLFEFKDSTINIGELYKFAQTAPNKLKFHSEDPNIIPAVNDYLVLQRFFDDNIFTNESTTDDLNNVIVYPKGELFQFKITAVTPSVGTVLPISGATINLSGNVVTVSTTTGLNNGDKVYIDGIQGIPVLNGTFIINVLSLTTIELFALDGITAITGSGSYISGGSVKLLPLYEVTLDKSFAPIGSNSPTLTIDPGFGATNATPIVITTITPHLLLSGTKVRISGVVGNTAANGDFYISSTGVNTFELYADSALLIPIVGNGAYVSGGSIVIAPAKYTMVLLNRMGTNNNQELFTNTWRQTEIHRQQLLGDPFKQTNILKFVGATNYLNYTSSSFLGMRNQMSGIMQDRKTPFVVFDIQDDIHDRLYDADGVIELHLPTVMINGESSRVVLQNQGPVLTDLLGDGTYSPLYFLTGVDPSIRYGWVMHELRVVIIDHPELATALAYNSNRNYTLPAPTIKHDNTIQNPTASAPITIVGVSGSTPVTISTATAHGLSDGDFITVTGINALADNVLPNGQFYVKKITVTSFEMYFESTLTTAVPGLGSTLYTGGGQITTGKLPYEYFVTYRLNGKHYSVAPYAETIDFNFNVNDQLQITIPTFSGLADRNTSEGFEADSLEIIIGRYQSDGQTIPSVTGIDYVLLAPAVKHNSLSLTSGAFERRRLPLKDASGAQITTPHIIIIQRNDLEDATHAVLLDNTLGGSGIAVSPTLYDGSPNVSLLNANVLFDLVTTGPSAPTTKYMTIYNQALYYDDVVLGSGYDTSISTSDSTLFAGEGLWTIGFVKYKQQAKQFRLTLRVPIPAAKWNATLNPSYEPGNALMPNKLITEIGFLVIDPSGTVVELPYIFGKISPPLAKNNSSDLSIELSIDF